MRRRIIAAVIAASALLGLGGVTAVSAGATVTAAAPLTHYYAVPLTHYYE